MSRIFPRGFMQVRLVLLLWLMRVASQATCFVYFWVALVCLREGSLFLAEKAKMCLFIPFVVTLIQEELLRKTRIIRL